MRNTNPRSYRVDETTILHSNTSRSINSSTNNITSPIKAIDLAAEVTVVVMAVAGGTRMNLRKDRAETETGGAMNPDIDPRSPTKTKKKRKKRLTKKTRVDPHDDLRDEAVAVAVVGHVPAVEAVTVAVAVAALAAVVVVEAVIIAAVAVGAEVGTDASLVDTVAPAVGIESEDTVTAVDQPHDRLHAHGLGLVTRSEIVARLHVTGRSRTV